MANLSNVIKVTASQYNTLVNGGTVSGQTYDANALYLVEADEEGLSDVVVSGSGNAVTNASLSDNVLTLTKGTTFLTSHQSIKNLKTDNTSAQTTSSSESITGSGTINLHKIAKTGTYSDLIGKPSINDATLTIQKNGSSLQTFTANSSTNKTANITFATNEVTVPEAGNEYIDLVGGSGDVQSAIQAAFTPGLVQYVNTSNISAVGYPGADFSNFGTSNNSGLYIFTYAYCMVLLPIYNPTAGTDYKVAAVVMDGNGSYTNQVLTYRYTSNGHLYVYQKNSKIPTGYTAYLFKIALY